MHFGEQNGNALFDLSGYIARGFNAHIWVSVPGSICSNGDTFTMYIWFQTLIGTELSMKRDTASHYRNHHIILI